MSIYFRLNSSARSPIDFSWVVDVLAYEYSDEDFEFLRRAAHRFAGISLSEHKRALLYHRLSRRLRALDLRTFAEYRRVLENDGAEIELFINAVTTNYTFFFREPHHFEFLRSHVLPATLARNASTKEIRIWSAGCSTGQEPYSIASTLYQNVPRDWSVKILASDLDTDVLATARRGEYSAESLNMPREQQASIFLLGQGAMKGRVRVRPELQRMVTFRQLNLIEPWPISGRLDAIFCRNVIIYFDPPGRARLLRRFEEILAPGGHLFLGHSESIAREECSLQPLGKTTFEKSKGAAA